MLLGFRDKAIKRAMKLMSNPKVAKLVMDPRVMKIAMQALTARSRAKSALNKQVEGLAKSLGFATKKEVRELESAIRTLQSSLERLQEKQENAPAKKKAAKKS